MCGIVAVVRRRTQRKTPERQEVLSALEAVVSSFPAPGDGLAGALKKSSEDLTAVDYLLRGEAGIHLLLGENGLLEEIQGYATELVKGVVSLEEYLEAEGEQLDDVESINAALVDFKDVVWALEKDRLRAAVEVSELANGHVVGAAVPWLFSLQQTLSNIDRIEVRGRDSAGVQVLVSGHGLDLDSVALRDLVGNRMTDPLFMNGSVRLANGHLAFVYKAAAEIGELGDNTAAIRSAIAADELLHLALKPSTSRAVVLAHTRWASVGIISEPNAHPINSEEVSDISGPYVAAVLNGDVDNFADLKVSESLAIASEITTDTKVIPTLVSRKLASGVALDEAIRSSAVQFEGSVAIGIHTAEEPDDLHLALRGSGQGVFVGLAEDAFVIASEPYGVVEDSVSYLRMDGETPADPDNPTGSQGQIIRLHGKQAGLVEGVTRVSYDGSSLPVSADEWKKPEVTTRDIDRGDNPHFLLKEISEAPTSFKKTLRGRLVESDAGLTVQLPVETISSEVEAVLTSGAIKRIEVIGQGTAAVAGQAIASSLGILSSSELSVRAVTATELSGFELREDMSDTLVIAVSQSGTTTDTNRTVDVVRSRGALVLCIVNRRGSDLVDKSDGVLYTSDGRDVEMSVASTKAFYSQIAAGFLLADRLSQLLPGVEYLEVDRQALLVALRDLPEAMTKTLGSRSSLESATRHIGSRRYWAIVGNGANHIAAKEIRIKLSELCYKAIACDVTEDKKHIDLSSEPLILVCAAGLEGSNADDVSKEVDIFKAHKAAPIVIATEGENRFSAALEVIYVPQTHSKLAFILSTMVGHLFGYEAALSIDASALSLREIRGTIEKYVGSEGVAWFAEFADEVRAAASQFFDLLRTGSYNGSLEASTATKTAALLRFALGSLPLESYQSEFGKVGTPGVVVEDLALALTAAIEELTRPIDAIKHQAKTVTVGISRADESLLQSELTKAVLDSGCPRDSLTYRSLRTLAAVAPAVTSITGYTRYSLDGSLSDDTARIFVVDKGGVAADLSSRVEKDPLLRGTKHRVAVERLPIVTVGTDGRVVCIIPEVKDKQTIGLTLCHIVLKDKLRASTAQSILQGYRNRYRQLVDVVTESDPNFREDILAEVPTVALLTDPISEVASHWVK